MCQFGDSAACDHPLVGSEQRGAEHRPVLRIQFLAEAFRVRYLCSEHRQPHSGDYFFIPSVQSALFPFIHQIPEEVKPFQPACFLA